ncbi:carboxylesterase/lipase family protein [Haladaptatus sp. YSMS36]|uniref:carboxylesterase/lipase family protein n=1 Tax=Haladaptatus sp. YSMS36 TaxID=3033384 RepID=UPI0023E8AF65|nr:carboxylesterase/lipase family protein [Haladaptatus sp. YSMS36]
MNTLVSTRSGTVRGSEVNGVCVFKGIPFAAPPYEENRFQPPQPPAPWSGVRDALTYGPKSPQPEYPPEVKLILPELTDSGEDCLTLNIWTQDPGSATRPVMVWIPGGVYEYHGTSASPWYDGSRFARDGVVCVTISYRVGADGFLYFDDGIENLGLLDQVAALEWVQENIAAFGGDPKNVTIFGESAGAMSVATLLAMPSAEGLFQHAIAQSGGAQHVLSPETGTQIAQHLAEKLGVEATREAIADVPVDRVLAAQEELRVDLQSTPDPERWGGEVVATFMPWQPVVDGDVLPAVPLDCIEAGASSDIDLLVGTNTDEHRLFLVASGIIDQITEEALSGAVAAYGLSVEEALSTYRNLYPDAGAGDLLAAIQTDWFWRIPAIRLADAHAKNAQATYMYEFAWRSPQFNGRIGACHALEIPFVFDTLGNETEALWGPNPPQSLADTMHAAWVGFATTGDCGWPLYNFGRRATMHFDTTSEVVDDPVSNERTLWEGVR